MADQSFATNSNPSCNVEDKNTLEAVSLLIRCADFAAKKHKDQRRKDPEKTPYINHPLGVAKILIDEGGVYDPATLAAAILHDTVEDTQTTFDELESPHVQSHEGKSRGIQSKEYVIALLF